jgi:endonuclease YncB( thermonuclease family)
MPVLLISSSVPAPKAALDGAAAMSRVVTWVLAAMLTVAGAAAQTGAITAVDGDTVISNGKTYRLVGFDTPETGDRAQCDAERVLGEKAKARLRTLINRGDVELTEVRCACVPGTEGTWFCNWGRSCAILRVRGLDVGSILIRERLARPFVCWKYQCPMRQSWCGR